MAITKTLADPVAHGIGFTLGGILVLAFAVFNIQHPSGDPIAGVVALVFAWVFVMAGAAIVFKNTSKD